MIKNASWGLLALAALVAFAPACRREPPPPEGYQGIVELDERLLAFEVPGRVETVDVRRGDLVKDGQRIAKLDDSLERLTRQVRADDLASATADLALVAAGARAQDVASLAAEVRAATTSVDLATKTLDRVRSLHASGAVPQAELDRAQADLDRAVAQRRSIEQRLSALRQGARQEELARAEARVETAKSVLALEDARLERHELKSKGEGLVIDVHVEPGELAGVGTPAATVADVTHPYVDVFVPEGKLAGIRVGTRATVRVDTGAQVDGKVEYVSPKTEFTPRFLFSERERPHIVVRVRVRLEDPRRELHAGVPAFARFSP
jgi:HlyD family secretion protein